MIDIPLARAMLCFSADFEAASGDAKVFEHPDRRGASRAFPGSVLACNIGWDKLTDDQRLAMLFIEAWQITAFYGVPADRLHAALTVIPEYRRALAPDLPGSEASSSRG